MTAFSLGARLHLGANSDLALSLPQSSPLYPKRLDSSLLRGSRGGYRRRPQMLPKCKPQVSPPGRAALIRHGAAQKRSTAPPSPRGRLRRCSKAKPLRGSRGRSRANARIHLRAQLLAPHSQGFFPIHRAAIQRRTAPQAHSPKAPRSISPRQGCCRWRRFR